MASNDFVPAPPPTKAEALNTRILAIDPPTVVASGGRLTITENGLLHEAGPYVPPEQQALIDLGILDWDDPDLVLPPWAKGLTPEERQLVQMVGNSAREPYARQLRAYREAKGQSVDNSGDAALIGLAPPALRAPNAAQQDLPGATPTRTAASGTKERPKPRYVDRSKSTSTYEGTGEPKPEGPAPKIEFAVLSDEQIQRVRPAAHVIRHIDHSKGYRLERFPFPKDLFNRRR